MALSAQTTGQLAMGPQAYAAKSYAAAVQGAGAKAAAKVATPEQRAKIEKTAKGFEASFLSSMMGQMFEGTEIEAPFGGGAGESAFRSFLMDAMAKSMADRGGVGISSVVTREMLKMQGLS
jgi:peptidoglycan hydrolase FlgJ